ncbi:hypothetical protein CEXT_813621 [Caerostris extrusa]|uniref:Uncharacterized protein n=1 Tax=Caerostris extrusa TaxID=172846 RepID=A0AAV4YAX7_CAEEX|nr:hypothetical protein CEXT_813621 [Caerostris extrusa]
MKLLFLFPSRSQKKPFFQRRSFQFRFATLRRGLWISFHSRQKQLQKCFIKKEIPYSFILEFSSRWQPFSLKTEMRNEEKKKLTASCIRLELDETIGIWKSILVLLTVNNIKNEASDDK